MRLDALLGGVAGNMHTHQDGVDSHKSWPSRIGGCEAVQIL